MDHFNHGRYFEAHDVWEEIWRAMTGPEREAMQGLIQLAVTCHHFRRGNLSGARSSLANARGHLAAFLPVYLGINLPPLLDEIGRCLESGAPDALPALEITG